MADKARRWRCQGRPISGMDGSVGIDRAVGSSGVGFAFFKGLGWRILHFFTCYF